MADDAPSTHRKALALNLDHKKYGTIAEIGAGQEVARWFFHVGGAAGTIAKSISAYDMGLSTALYGPTQRFVSRERLEAMLDHECRELVDALDKTRGETTAFFAFADTVATRSYKHPGNGRGWMGIRFQKAPREAYSEIILHVHLFDATAVHQQEVLGILGVNLIYGALFRNHEPLALIGSLMDELSRGRAEIDMIKFSGPAFATIDNRLMSLQLVEQGLTDAAMFTAAGEVVQPADVCYRRPVLVERGRFRPVTRVHVDLLERAREQFMAEPEVNGRDPVVLAEMTLSGLGFTEEAGVDHADFLARADLLGTLGVDVLISRFRPYYQVADYLVTYTDQMIGIALGLPAMFEVGNAKYYDELPGGLIESTGRLFKRSVKMYVYPGLDLASGQIMTIERAPMPPPWQYLRDLLVETRRIESIKSYDASALRITTDDVLARIRRRDPSWEEMVPPGVAALIKAKQLFGHAAAG
jgi:hypothetical protein